MVVSFFVVVIFSASISYRSRSFHGFMTSLPRAEPGALVGQGDTPPVVFASHAFVDGKCFFFFWIGSLVFFLRVLESSSPLSGSRISLVMDRPVEVKSLTLFHVFLSIPSSLP